MTGIRLRETTLDDVPVLYGYQNDPDASRLANVPVRSYEAYLNHWSRRVLADETVMKRTVLVDDAIAGGITCWDEAGDRTIGYWFGQEFRGRGVGTAAVREFVAAAPWRPLYADPAVRNVGSVRLLQRCGFTAVETVEHRDHHGDGRVEHVVLKLE